MGWMGRALAATVLGAVMCCVPAIARQPAAQSGEQEASTDARDMAQWVRKSRDHRGMPFAIVDKRQARIHVFDGVGQLRGTSPVLLGQAPGDHSAPNVGEHAQAGRVPFHERTTPAGRFTSQPGTNLSGESVVWVDYDSAFAIHRLRGGPGLRDRQERMASPQASRHRASLGCVVVPPDFYDKVVHRFLGRNRAVVYVLPEQRSLRELLDSL